MLISGAVARALEDVATRERDVLQAYAPGAMPERSDVGRAASAQPVLDPLSVAAPNDAYFLIGGDGRTLFTRDGSFSVANGTLSDAQGRPVLGYANACAALAPLRADPVDAALGFAASARVDASGAVTYERSTVDPQTGRKELQQVTIGRVALARFAAGTKLQSIDAQHAAAPPGIAPHLGCAADGSFGAIVPFARADSGVDIDRGLERLQDAYLALDAIRASIAARRGVEKTTMDLLK